MAKQIKNLCIYIYTHTQLRAIIHVRDGRCLKTECQHLAGANRGSSGSLLLPRWLIISLPDAIHPARRWPPGRQAGRQWPEQTLYAGAEDALNTLSKPLQTAKCALSNTHMKKKTVKQSQLSRYRMGTALLYSFLSMNSVSRQAQLQSCVNELLTTGRERTNSASSLFWEEGEVPVLPTVHSGWFWL